MHLLLTALGSYGDVYPMIGLGAEARRRGSRVTVVTNPHFEADVRAAGLGFAAVSSRERYDQLTLEPGLWSPTRGLGVVFRQGALAVLRELYETVSAAYTTGETVIAAHGLDLASRCAAEAFGAPVASVVFAPMALWSDSAPPRMPAGLAWPGAPRWLHHLQFRAGERLVVDSLVRPAVAGFRAELGLPALRGSFWSWYYGVAPPLCLFPDWFVDPSSGTPTDWPAGTATTGFPFGDGAGGRESARDPAVEAFLDAGDAPIVFTPGSAMRRGERFFAAAVDACRRLGRRGVLLTKYPEQLPKQLPDTVLAPGFTPLGGLLDRAAAFVHHGGIGSSARGLAAGKPQLVQPMAFDQHDNAWRLRRLGVGDELSPRRFHGANVAQKLQRLLSDPKTAAACARWSARIDPGSGVAAACDLLQRRLAVGAER